MVEWRGVNQPSAVSLVDVLDKVLDKGLVVVGDISVSLANVELLTVKVRLMLCSIDKANEVGLDWWKQDPFFSSSAGNADAALQERVEALEKQLAESQAAPESAQQAPRRRRARPRQDTT